MALGADAVSGDLTHVESYRHVVRGADAIVHLGFDYRTAAETDRLSIDGFLEATEDRESHLVYTSGMWVVGDTGGATVGDDASTDHPAEIVAWRSDHERRFLAGHGAGRTASVVRPGHVYGRGGGLTARMFATAVRSGEAEFVGEGSAFWSNIHVDDLARLYAAVVEAGDGGVYQAVDGTPERTAIVAEAASRAAGAEGRTRSVPLDQARQKMGAFADAMCLDQKLSAPRARSLGWEPEYVSFTSSADVAFAEWDAARSR